MECWQGDDVALTTPRPVILGFPQDEGVRRNGGRTGAAAAPAEIRHWLARFTPWHGPLGLDLSATPPLDLGDIRTSGDLETSQEHLGKVIAAMLARGLLPVVLGGGHETAYGTYLGYVQARRGVGVLNVDAHLDVRPCLQGKGHSGSPFRQMLEHVSAPLPGSHYVCLGLQPFATARAHQNYAEKKGCVLHWASACRGSLLDLFRVEYARLARGGTSVHVSIDADVIQMAAMPGVSAPNPLGLSADTVIELARLAGELPAVTSFEVVEINPWLDRDGQSARWGALLVWHFLIGWARRPRG